VKHKHSHNCCKHCLHYCPCCGKVYCCKCGQEWGVDCGQYHPPYYPVPNVPITPTYIPDVPYYEVTWGGTTSYTCSHEHKGGELRNA